MGKGFKHKARSSPTRKDYGREVNSIARKGSRGDFVPFRLPLAESRGGASGGVWGNAPTVPRATISPNALNKGAGSEASLPVTLRVRRRAPKLHIRPLAHCRAKWARPTTCPSNPTTCRFSLAEIRFLRYDILIRKEVTPHG